jgi:quercetin dioxygenase-like cupin family protein
MRKAFLIVSAVVAVAAIAIAGAALGTPARGVTAETARGDLATPLKVNTKFANGARVKLQARGALEVITQRIVAIPGATFGWHTHPGENVNVILQGTLTLYHDENCTRGTAYPAGSTFTTHPNEVHLARNEGTQDLILFATYFAPKTTPPLPVRIDQPLPAPGCPE